MRSSSEWQQPRRVQHDAPAVALHINHQILDVIVPELPECLFESSVEQPLKRVRFFQTHKRRHPQ